MELDNQIVRAVRTDDAIRIDGRFTEAAWDQAIPASSFVQWEPDEGASASEKTEVRILYDDKNLYISVVCFDTEPDKIVATEMRRDIDLEKNDRITLILDTFHDHRGAFFFEFNPLGARVDGIVTDEGQDINRDWNGVWHCAASITDSGWTGELCIPFRTLRFEEQTNQSWGFNIVRYIRRKNEKVSWAPLLRDYGFNAMYKVSSAGHLVGMKDLRQRNLFQVKPYALGGLETDGDTRQTDLSKQVGLDLKYSLTSNLIADVTINTDFAQVENDEMQVNLTRFNLFFPEKRDFFLEGAGIFRFGEQTPKPGNRVPSMLLFFSRRIGLAEGKAIPILGGVKTTGKIGKTSVGLLSMQVKKRDIANGDGQHTIVPSTNFTAIRLKHDILQKSSIGLIFLNKQVRQDPNLDRRAAENPDLEISEDYSNQYNRVAGVDLNLSFLKNLKAGGYIAKSFSPGPQTHDWSMYGYFDWRKDLWNVKLVHQDVQENFKTEMGFVPRKAIKKSLFDYGVSPRPKITFIRQLFFSMENAWYHSQQDVLLSRDHKISFFNLLSNSGMVYWNHTWNTERIIEQDEFEVKEDRFILPGLYSNQTWNLGLHSDKSRRIAGECRLTLGDFYGGGITTIDGKVVLTPNKYLSIETSFNTNSVKDITVLHSDVDYTSVIDFSTTVLRSRWNVSITPDLYTRTFLQWNSDTRNLSVNFMFHWIYTPGSGLYFVYNEFWEGARQLTMQNRTVLLKLAHLFQL